MSQHVVIAILIAGVLSSPLPLLAGPLHQAVRARDLVSLESMLNPAADVDVYATVRGGVTALHLAAATDQRAAAEMLIKRGAPVDLKTTTGFTPLHWAASRNATETVALLLEHGANVGAKANSNITPLHWAAGKDAAGAVKLLIEAGADISAVTELGYTPLHLAVKLNPYSKAAVLLAQARVDSELESGVLVIEDLPDDSTETNEVAAIADDELPEVAPPVTPAILPGTFLSVPLGLGSSLSFVWVEALNIWFGKYEITNSQYQHYDRRHSSRTLEGHDLNGPQQPVVFVSWHEATAYCNWLNRTFSDRIPGQCEFRLPVASEWEFVAACGSTRPYPWGDDWPPLYGNHSDATARENLSQWNGIRGYKDGYAVTCPVDHSGMNEWGVYGLAGNVWEWCLDWMDNTDRQLKVRKGGSWDFDPKASLKINARGLDRPTARYDTIGFRVVVAPKAAK
ncbi:MAG: SUMF1/EgtB/PvdO family nonheme iron enzyme [Verrucomicrobia bacterium]|jgi:hypothetical protein|nr:SUMF1/EgtB/PvdO family nonheme iron enzyme [Verrucomicrobiota bacterium]